MAKYGFLIPVGGGDPIPLAKNRLVLGRRDNCDIILQFPNVSGQHCRLTMEQGYWFLKDLASRNGTKVNGYRVDRKRLDPGAVVTIAKHQYRIEYDPESLGAYGAPPPDDDHLEQVLKRSLLDRAGLHRRADDDDVSDKGRNRNIIDED